MENLFRPGKWLVIFCAIFIGVWFVLQFVSQSRLKEEAKVIAQQVFSFRWPGEGTSQAQVTDVNVVQKSDKDAVVKIRGRQNINYETMGGASDTTARNETVDFSATLTFYKMSGENPTTKKVEDYWVLGQVDFPEVN